MMRSIRIIAEGSRYINPWASRHRFHNGHLGAPDRAEIAEGPRRRCRRSDGRYRRIFILAPDPGAGRFTQPTAATQA